MRIWLLCFAAGCVGALANSLVVWLFGELGLTARAGVAIAPAFSAAWLYPRIVWGGLWGLLFALSAPRQHAIAHGLFVSLGPTLFQLLVVFPFFAAKGFGGLELGLMTPLFVLGFNAVWGIVTALVLFRAR